MAITRTIIADIYYFSSVRAFNKLIMQTELPKVMPKILKKKASFFPKELEIIAEHIGQPSDYAKSELIKRHIFERKNTNNIHNVLL